jgi:glycosyltransferase involved in cell wall biosynthesis
MVRSLREHGFDVVISGLASGEGATTWEGIEVIPSPLHASDGLTVIAEELIDPGQGDRIITMVNMWRLFNERLAGRHVISWLPVDCEPVSPAVASHFAATGTRPVAFSEFGRVQLERVGLAGVALAPLGIDTTVFAPLEPGDRRASWRAARSRLGLPEDRFVIGVVATNKNHEGEENRKSWPELLSAVGVFAADRADVTLFLHTDPTGHDRGLDLLPLLERLRAAAPRLEIRWTRPFDYRRGLSDREMAVLYNAMDVLVSPSAGEGFGLGLIEAQACGVPVIATDFSAQTENVVYGRLVSGQRRWIPHLRGEWMTPSISQIAEALAELAEEGSSGWTDGVDFARSREHRRLFAEHWLPLLDVVPLADRLSG